MIGCGGDLNQIITEGGRQVNQSLTSYLNSPRNIKIIFRTSQWFDKRVQCNKALGGGGNTTHLTSVDLLYTSRPCESLSLLDISVLLVDPIDI